MSDDYQKYTGHVLLNMSTQGRNSAAEPQRQAFAATGMAGALSGNPQTPVLDQIAKQIRDALMVTSAIRDWLDHTTEAEPVCGAQTAPHQARVPSLMADAAFLREELEMIVRRLSLL